MFVVFEGIDGCGKSTVAKALQQYIRDHNPDQKVVLEAEPTHQGVGKVLREVLQQQEHQALQNPHFIEYMALAMAADRQYHYWQKIRPELQNGTLVLGDRFSWSSYAYQGATGMDLRWLVGLNSKVPVPDLTVLIDLDPDTAIQRVRSKNSKDLFEDTSTLQKVASRYVYLAARQTGFPSIDKAGLLVVDGSRTVDQLVTDIYPHVQAWKL